MAAAGCGTGCRLVVPRPRGADPKPLTRRFVGTTPGAGPQPPHDAAVLDPRWRQPSCNDNRNWRIQYIAPRIVLRCEVLAGEYSPPSLKVLDSAVEGDSVLLPLGPPLPPDAVSAVRGESGMLGGLSVPLSWGVAVPPDDYDHWASEPGEGADADVVAAEGISDATTEGMDEWDEWGEWEAEPRFDVPRSSSVIPHSPAAG